MTFEKNERIFALVDCNAFYCSCERLFRPDLWHKPVGVLSNNDGCFVSRTIELKELGVPMGAPYFQYKNICDKNNVAVFSANFALYTNLSDRVMNTLFDFTPHLEVYSVDEAFLDLTGFKEEKIFEYCLHIKKVVERHTGIPVGIGIGRTKVLAKVANKIAKKKENVHGVFSLLDQAKIYSALKNFPIEEVWGIGLKNSLKMKSLGISYALELRDFKNELLIQKQFTKIGRMIQDELKEISCFPLNTEIVKKKEIICSRTFGSPVFELKSLRESIANYASLAAEKLRKQKSVCQGIEIYIRTNPFKDVPQYMKVASSLFASPTCDTRKIIKEAFKILDEIYIFGYEYKKASVKLFKIEDSSGYQISFLDEYDSKLDLKLMWAMDQINLKEGTDLVRSAACGTDKKAWQMKQVLKSPRYVTGWSEIFKI